MAKDPAFLFYPADFQIGTEDMTDEQVGKYIRLMCRQKLKGHIDEKHMLKICETYDKDIFDKFEKDENGLYFNKRLELEIIKRSKYSESRAKNRGGRDTTEKEKKDMSNICNSYEKHMENENENINVNKKVIIKEEFENFYSAYPRKESKGKAETAYEKALKDGVTSTDLLDGVKRYCKHIKKDCIERQFIKLPATWLNQKCWEDKYTVDIPKAEVKSEPVKLAEQYEKERSFEPIPLECTAREILRRKQAKRAS